MKRNVLPLIDVHGLAMGTNRGKRGNQSLNHAMVVLTAAAWEYYVEDICVEVPEIVVAASPGTPLGNAADVLKEGATHRRNTFHTPNAEKSKRHFLRSIGLNPTSSWNLEIRKSSVGRFAPSRARNRLDGWLDVRHAVAHGADLPNKQFIRNRSNNPSLTLHRAKECMEFFVHLVSATEAAVDQHLISKFGLATGLPGPAIDLVAWRDAIW